MEKNQKKEVYFVFLKISPYLLNDTRIYIYDCVQKVTELLKHYSNGTL